MANEEGAMSDVMLIGRASVSTGRRGLHFCDAPKVE